MRERKRCGCYTNHGPVSSWKPLEEFPTKWQAKGSILIKKPVDGWTWIVVRCPLSDRPIWHIRRVEVPHAGSEGEA
jgi:hypothetical protein